VAVREVGKGKELAWSPGLGLEVSPIKTHSARKKLGSTPVMGTQHPVSSLDLGVLRGIKSIARAKI